MRMLGWTCVVAALLATTAVAKPVPSKLVVSVPVLEVLDPGGSVSAASVKESFDKLERELAKCGDDSKWTGDVLVWLITDWHGKVERAEIAVGKPAVERCFLAVLRRLRIAKAQSRATTMMRVRLAAPPAPSPPPDRP